MRLDHLGVVTVETDMTDIGIGIGIYTIIAQTAAEMMGIGVGQVGIRLGDSRFPESPGQLAIGELPRPRLASLPPASSCVRL